MASPAQKAKRAQARAEAEAADKAKPWNVFLPPTPPGAKWSWPRRKYKPPTRKAPEQDNDAIDFADY